MKKLLVPMAFVMAWVCLALTASGSQLVTLEGTETQLSVTDQGQQGVILEIGIGELQLHEVSTPSGPFTLMSFDGCARSQEIGEPNLPMANRLLSIPFGCDLKVDVLSYETQDIPLNEIDITNPLIPVQYPVSKSDDPASIPFEYNSAVYLHSGFYTLPLADVKTLGTMRSVNLGLVTISPVEYNPSENLIRVYKSLTVRVTYENADWLETERQHRRLYSPFFESAFSRIANYSQQSAQFRDDLVTYPVKYIIVADRMFEAQLQPFIQWKTKKGFIVVTGYTDVIGSTTALIKNFIDSIYSAASPPTDPAPSFVLFVGDDQQIPAYSGYSGHISDLWMCEFTGDNLPEIYYGRFSAQNPTQLQPQIDKTLQYEQYTMPDPSFLGDVTMIAGVDAGHAPTHGNGQINYGTNLYFNAAHGIYSNTWLYPASAESGASAAIIQTVQDGVGFINYTAHCGHSGHSNPSFTTGDVAGLSNADMYPLGIGNCCLANTFGSSYGSPCFGEAWLQKEGGGGMGYIGGTNSTYWDEDYWWGVGNGPVIGGGPTYEETGLGAYDGIFHDHGEPVTDHYITNDAIIFRGNLAVTEANSSLTAYYWQIYHLMGDPSIMTYMGVPSVNAVTHPSAAVFTTTSIDVSADPGSYVGISLNGVLHGAGYVDASGSVTVDLLPFSQPDIIDIVVTAQNREPYVSTIQLFAPEGAYVVYDEYTVNDAAGNGNGLVDGGESILLGLQLKNVGPDTAINVEATIASSDSYVSISDASESYGSIPGNDGTSFIADGFAFSVSPSAPDRHTVSFDLTITGTNRDTWEGSFTVPVHAPSLAYGSVSINDASGNSNGILDPGETVEVVVTLTNSGSGQASNVSAVLSETDSYISISDDYGYYGLVDSISGSASNSSDVYLVSAEETSPMGYAVSFGLAVSGDLGLSTTLSFELIVGDRVAFYTDDFSFDQGWSGLGGSGEWTIGPATGGTGSDGSGGPDPAVDHTPTEDNGVLGNDLTPGTGGDYNSGLGSTYWVTSPMIDCGDFTGVQMEYYHWLGVESPSYDHVYLQVYDGASWVTLYENTGTVNETSWSSSQYDLSAYADENVDFQIRFGIGPTDGSVQYCGWNLDDLILKGYDQSGGGSAIVSFLETDFTDSLVEGTSSQQTVRVYNSGDGNLRIRFSSPNGWISCSTDQNYIGPGDSLDFPFTIDASGMAPGDHAGSLHFTCNDYGYQSGDLAVLLHVYAPGVSFESTSLVDSLVGGDSSVVTLRTYNQGAGNLHISFSTPPTWLSCSEDEQTVAPLDSVDVAVTINSLGLAPGDHVGSVHYECDDPENPSGDVPVLLHIYVPSCDIPTGDITAASAPGEEQIIPLVINNTGPGRLSYSISCQTDDSLPRQESPSQVASFEEPLGYRPCDDDKSGAQAPFFGPVSRSHGGPDLYGYSWVDSDDPAGPVFSWVDISTVGTVVSLGDDESAGPFAIGFPFPYYDSMYSELYFNSNGLVTFGSGTPARLNTGIPVNTVPNNMLAVWWDDLDPGDGGAIYYYYDASSSRFIISYEGVPNYQYPDGTGSLTFQVILQANGKITMQYETMDAGGDGEGLESATIGIENPVGDDGLQVAYNAAYMHDQLAIDFTVVRWLWVEPAGGWVEPYSSASIDVHLDATDLDEGTYTGQLGITTNDPVVPVVTIPVSLGITTFMCGDIDGNQEGPNVADVTYLVDYLFNAGPEPPVMAAADVNGIDGNDINVADLTYFVEFIFNGGPQPVCH